MPTTGQLQDKVAIITGAARGQGAAEATRFAQEGAHVIAGDVLEADRVVHLDVTSPESWHAVVSAAVAEYGRIDVLLNNAGIRAAAPVHEMPVADFRRVLDVNLIGPLLGIQAVVPDMRVPTDIAAAAVFLASDDASWISGADFTVDGGHMASTPKL